jgi:hypothetical protein
LRDTYKTNPYHAPEFIEPQPDFSEASLKEKIKQTPSRIAHIATWLMISSFIFLFFNIALAVSFFMVSVLLLNNEKKKSTQLTNGKLKDLFNEETSKYNVARQQAYIEYTTRIDSERAEHLELEEERRSNWLDENRFRERLKSSITMQDVEPLAELLEVELSNEDLPVPLVFDIEFLNVHEVKIFIELQEIDVVPEKKVGLKKDGSLSTQSMTQKERFKIYSNVNVGLALRLIYETFRVLHPVENVSLVGLSEKLDLHNSNNNSNTITSLYVKVVREEFEVLDLDAADPMLIFAGIGGKFACSNTCELISLESLESNQDISNDSPS